MKFLISGSASKSLCKLVREGWEIFVSSMSKDSPVFVIMEESGTEIRSIIFFPKSSKLVASIGFMPVTSNLLANFPT